MKIENGTVPDARRLAAFARQTFLATYGGENPSAAVRQHVAVALTEEAVLRDLRDPATTIIYARPDAANSEPTAEILGYATLRWNRPIKELMDDQPVQLERIYVDHRHHSGGVGSFLISQVLTLAARRSVNAVWLTVWKENPRAHAFYEKNGFERVGETVFMMGPEPEEDFIYARRTAN